MTRRRVAGATFGLLLRTRETVATETPAARPISATVARACIGPLNVMGYTPLVKGPPAAAPPRRPLRSRQPPPPLQPRWPSVAGHERRPARPRAVPARA